MAIVISKLIKYITVCTDLCKQKKKHAIKSLANHILLVPHCMIQASSNHSEIRIISIITAFSPSISLPVGEILNEMVSTLLHVLATKAGASSSFVNSIIIRLQRGSWHPMENNKNFRKSATNIYL